MSQIVLRNELIRDYAEHEGWLRPETGKLHLIGFRGARPVGANVIELHPNAPDRFNDAIGTFGMDLHLYPGTTDPGRFYTQHPSNERGAAWLVPGVYRYRIGKHKGHPALVQLGDVVIRRDRDRDGRPEESDGPREILTVSLNIHYMGEAEHAAIYNWSAGCQGMPNPGWDAFFNRVVQAAHEVYKYTLIDAKRFFAWHAALREGK